MLFTRIKAFVRLSRIPFLSVSLAPVILGGILTAQDAPLSYPLMALALATTAFIQLATHYMGEYGDYETDSLNQNYTPFSGGSRTLQENLFTPRFALAAALTSLGISILLGLTIFFAFRTGPLTLPLGAFGILCGFFYSAKPFRWAYTGFGEVLIGICYGWLCVNTPYYLHLGRFGILPTMASLPAAFSIMAVIIMNEFPDFESDRISGKKNLVVRWGKARMAVVYQALLVLTCLSALLLFFFGLSPWLSLLFLPSLFLALANIRVVQRRGYQDRQKLVQVCGRTISLNLMTTATLSISFLL